MLALVHPVLAESSTSERCEPFEASGVRCRSCDDSGVFQRAMLFQGTTNRRDGRAFLADGYVDAPHLLGGITRFPVGFLVKNGVQADSSLTSLAVANDQLTLTATDGGHGVDSLNTGLQWFTHGLALQHRRCLQLQHTVFFFFNCTQAVNGLAQGVNDAAEECISDRYGKDLAGPLYFVALFKSLVVTQHHDTDAVSVKVLCDANDAARELKQLIRHD